MPEKKHCSWCVVYCVVWGCWWYWHWEGWRARWTISRISHWSLCIEYIKSTSSLFLDRSSFTCYCFFFSFSPVFATKFCSPSTRPTDHQQFRQAVEATKKKGGHVKMVQRIVCPSMLLMDDSNNFLCFFLFFGFAIFFSSSFTSAAWVHCVRSIFFYSFCLLLVPLAWVHSPRNSRIHLIVSLFVWLRDEAQCVWSHAVRMNIAVSCIWL